MRRPRGVAAARYYNLIAVNEFCSAFSEFDGWCGDKAGPAVLLTNIANTGRSHPILIV